MLVMQVGDYRPVFRLPFDLFLDLTCFMAENALSDTYVFPSSECIFSAKSFSLRNVC